MRCGAIQAVEVLQRERAGVLAAISQLEEDLRLIDQHVAGQQQKKQEIALSVKAEADKVADLRATLRGFRVEMDKLKLLSSK